MKKLFLSLLILILMVVPTLADTPVYKGPVILQDLTASRLVITDADKQLTSAGYTIATPTTGGLIYGSGTGAWANLTAGAQNKVLQMGATNPGWSSFTITLSGNTTLNDWFDQAVKAASTVTFGTVDTGQGANELYDMDQNVLTSSTPQFAGLTFSTDLILSREGAATFQLGADAAGVTNQMFKGPDRITSDGVGGNLTIAGGRNRGASVGGSIIFQTSPAAGAEVTGTLATVLTLASDKSAVFTGAITTTNLTDSGLTITRIPFASTAGLLIDDADLTFATDTLSATKLISSTSITSPQIYGSSAGSGTLTLTSTSHSTKGTISVGRLTLSDLANADGIIFASLGTATKAIDLSASGLSGATDFWVYNSSAAFWGADNRLCASLIQPMGALTLKEVGGVTRVTLNSYDDTDADGVVIVSGNNTTYPKDTIFELASASSVLFGNSTKVGSLTTCSSNGTTTITKTTHGLTLAAGELVHVTGSSTAADKGFYRIVSSGASTIVVDRALSGTQTDVALTVYKDVISMHATDVTNGQMLTSWSAQNKPLQLGGTVLAATATLTSADIVIGANIGLSQTQAASNQAGTLATVHTAGDPGIYFKVIDPATGTAYAVPGWAIP